MNRRLIWVSTINPFETLDVATWLNTTDELTKDGWDVTLIGFGPKGLHTVNGVEVTCFPWPETYFLGQTIYHLRVLVFLFRNLAETDVVLFHQISALWMLPALVYRWLLRSAQPKFVMDTRDLMDVTAISVKARLRMAFYGFVYRMAPHAFDGQTTITQRMAELVSIPPSQLWGIWPSGVELERYKASSANRTWPEPGEPIRLMYVGILLEKRNPALLCEAVLKAVKDGMNFELVFIGSGPEREKLVKYAAKSDGCIRILDPIPHSEIASSLASAHIGVTSLPEPDDAKYEASSPIKLFEYMAAGLPILATTNICHLDVVDRGNYAFWIDKLDRETVFEALRQIWDSQKELERLGQSALDSADGWTWSAAGRKLNDALSQYASTSSKPVVGNETIKSI